MKVPQSTPDSTCQDCTLATRSVKTQDTRASTPTCYSIEEPNQNPTTGKSKRTGTLSREAEKVNIDLSPLTTHPSRL